ncbi:MAG: hypothetical protein OEX82_00165 [Nitrosomonas sp.]|nr:hypothetical protein [Nitrosomonas sp.]
MLKKLKSLKLPKLNLSQSIKLPKFSKTSESPEAEDSAFSESLQSTKSLKSFKFNQKKVAKAASSVVLFGFSGWFLWNTFLAAPEPALPPSLPQAVATIDPTLAMLPPASVVEFTEAADDLIVAESEELIAFDEEMLAESETQKEVNEILDHVLSDTQQATMDTPDLATEQLETTELYVDEPTSETTTLASTSMPIDTPQEKQPYMLTARSNLDARDCLSLTENMAIHRCAENYR